MELIYYKWLIDFGLVVLIGLVQLIIYPSFAHVRKDALVPWHNRYTFRVSLIVFPLMMAQLLLGVAMVVHEPSFFTLGNLVLVVALFGITFLVFVPLHKAVSAGQGSEQLLNKLVQKNWLRTLLWTLIFVWTSVEIFSFS